MIAAKPTRRPDRPFFSSGPTAKPPGWRMSHLASDLMGRNIRSPEVLARFREARDLTCRVLEIPVDYTLVFTPASDTGAVEAAMWNLLGARPVQVLAYENFGRTWAADARDHLRLAPEILEADYGAMSDLSRVRPDADLVFAWNGTTSGVRVPNGDFIAPDRQGLTICDATSAAFAMALPWDRLDATTFSFQKALGGDAGVGALVLSPRAVERLDGHAPAWPVPKVLRLRTAEGFDRQLAEAVPINTYSLLTLEDWMACLSWAEGVGGLKALIGRTQANFRLVSDWVERTPWIDFLARDPRTRSETSVCLRFTEAQGPDFARTFAARLKAEGAAFDIESHRAAPAGLRLWCGATVETADIEALLPWLDWTYAALIESV